MSHALARRCNAAVLDALVKQKFVAGPSDEPDFLLLADSSHLSEGTHFLSQLGGLAQSPEALLLGMRPRFSEDCA